MSTQPTERWIPRDTLATRVLLVRNALGLSQREAAAHAGIGFGAWQSMEDGRSPRDLPAKIARMSMTFGVDRDWLMWGGPLAPPDDDGPGASATEGDVSRHSQGTEATVQNLRCPALPIRTAA
jgi:transcriptional regulator with XRE-family HTH domain